MTKIVEENGGIVEKRRKKRKSIIQQTSKPSLLTSDQDGNKFIKPTNLLVLNIGQVQRPKIPIYWHIKIQCRDDQST